MTSRFFGAFRPSLLCTMKGLKSISGAAHPTGLSTWLSPPVCRPANPPRQSQNCRMAGRGLKDHLVLQAQSPCPISIPALERGDYSFTPKGRNKEIKILVLCGFAFGIGETQNDINASQCLPHCLVLMLLFQARCGLATVRLHGGALHLCNERVSQGKETFRYTEKKLQH